MKNLLTDKEYIKVPEIHIQNGHVFFAFMNENIHTLIEFWGTMCPLF